MYSAGSQSIYEKFQEKASQLLNVFKLGFSMKLLPTFPQNTTKYFPTRSFLTLHKVKLNHPNDTNILFSLFAPTPPKSKTSPADTNLS